MRYTTDDNDHHQALVESLYPEDGGNEQDSHRCEGLFMSFG